MPPTTSFEPGDLVSVEFPFSDQLAHKRRPGLVLAVDDQDVLLARITTRPPRTPSDVYLRGWDSAGLPLASTVRLTKLATLDRRLIHRRIGRLQPADTAAVLGALENWVKTLAEKFK